MKKWGLLFLSIVLFGSCVNAGSNIEPIDNPEILIVEFNIQGAENKRGFITVESNIVVRADVEMAAPNGNLFSGVWLYENPANIFFTNDSSGVYSSVIIQTDDATNISTNTISTNLITGYHYRVDVALGGSFNINIDDGNEI